MLLDGAVSNRNISSELVWPFLGFPASSTDESCADAARVALNHQHRPRAGGWSLSRGI